MKNYLFVLRILIIFLLLNPAFAKEITMQLEPAPVDIHDMDSIKRGAKFFATTCMACHTLIYMRYNTLAKEAGITYDKMPIQVTNWPFAVKPPDLSLEADVHSPDWIYTYLHAFYQDSSRPSGVNNLVFPKTAMPGIISIFQGQQILLTQDQLKKGLYDHQVQWYDLLELKTQGTMTPEEFDNMVTDIVNFLVYAADPYKADQHRMGWWVISFLIILSILLYFLKKEYWKDIKNKGKE